jgi:hypothetical protein
MLLSEIAHIERGERFTQPDGRPPAALHITREDI